MVRLTKAHHVEPVVYSAISLHTKARTPEPQALEPQDGVGSVTVHPRARHSAGKMHSARHQSTTTESIRDRGNYWVQERRMEHTARAMTNAKRKVAGLERRTRFLVNTYSLQCNSHVQHCAHQRCWLRGPAPVQHRVTFQYS